MQIQTWFLAASLIGAMTSAVGAFGYAHFSSKASARDKAAVVEKLEKFQAALDKNTEQVFKAMNIKPDVWQSVTIESVPPGVADYILMLFRSDRGRISGKIRVKGSPVETAFSTTANDTVPVAIPNLWLPAQKHYQVPTILEYTITETTDAGATLTALTKGWMDSRGREPH